LHILFKKEISNLPPAEKDKTFVVLGHGPVGKSCLINRFLNDTTNQDLSPTIYKSTTKTFVVDQKRMILGNSSFLWPSKEITSSIEILDTSGDEEYIHLNKQGFILVYSIDNRESFENIESLRNMVIKMKRNRRIPCILVGAKSDVDNREVSWQEGKELADKYEMLFLEASAVTGTNCNEVFKGLTRKVWKKEMEIKGNYSDRACSEKICACEIF